MLVVGAFLLILMLHLCICVDALVYRWFGNTPGKALLGLSVRKQTGEQLSPSQYLHRNLAMSGPGFAFGIPLASVAAMFLSGVALMRAGATRWDRQGGYEAVGGRPRAWQFPAFIVLASAMLTIWRLDSQEEARAIDQLFLASRSRPQQLLTSPQQLDTPANMSSSAERPAHIAEQAVSGRKNPVSGLAVGLDVSGLLTTPLRADVNHVTASISRLPSFQGSNAS
jgi:RDD family